MAPVRLRVVGKRGAVVRSGAALDSAKVVTLARGSFVFAAGGYDAGASRVCGVAEGRSRGWVSAKVLEIAPLSFIEARRSSLQLVARFLDGPSLCRARLWGSHRLRVAILGHDDGPLGLIAPAQRGTCRPCVLP